MTTESAPHWILGISAGDHDAAAALLKGPLPVAALEEEKFLRIRRATGLPVHAIRYCLQEAGLRPGQVDTIALARPVEDGQRGLDSSEYQIPRRLRLDFPSSRIVVVDHHLCHAAAAFYPSSFNESAILTMDGQGDLKTLSLGIGRGTEIKTLRDAYVPDSLGNLYSRVTALAGFGHVGDEHRLQWLSAYGEPRFADVFRKIVAAGEGPLFGIDQSYYSGPASERGGFSEKFFEQAGLSKAEPLAEADREDLAASMQRVLEETVQAIVVPFLKQHGLRNLCLAGGVALNSLLVETLERSPDIAGVFVQPAAGNAGNALGAALYCAHSMMRMNPPEPLEHLFYGPRYSDEQIKDVLENCKLRFRYLSSRDEVISTAVDVIKDGRILGWFQGRGEFGPRALGARSILASPLSPYVNENLNQYVKHREKFRPFAASVPEERAADFFEFGSMAKFLASVGRVQPEHRKTFASNLLPDGRAGEGRTEEGSSRIRVQVVPKASSPLFWGLLESFGRATGVPVLYNTSFNLFGEPLVCSPRDAVRSFFCSGLDHLMIGHFFISK